jgi:hypothetical protein
MKGEAYSGIHEGIPEAAAIVLPEEERAKGDALARSTLTTVRRSL